MMGFNLQLGDALRSESVTAIDDAIRAIARQEIDRTPRSKFCESCAYMHQPEISARCCCVACHGDDVPAWAQRMNVTTPLSSEKTGDASPASEVKACQGCGHAASDHPHHGPNGQVGKRTNYGDEWMCLADYCRCRLTRGEVEAHNYRRTSAPSPASGESARTASKDASKELDELLAVFAKGDGDDEDCWTQPARRAQLYVASLRAEVERLRTALAEKEKAGVNANAVVERCIELVVRKKTPSWDEVSVWCDALRTALGAKETK